MCGDKTNLCDANLSRSFKTKFVQCLKPEAASLKDCPKQHVMSAIMH